MRDFDSLAADLTKNGVQTIVDVRSEPYSKHAVDFGKRRLEANAASAGFGYRWLGDKLGGRRAASPSEFAAGLEELAGLAATSDVVLLCAELEPTHCHRDVLLAPALEQIGYGVMHILGDGSVTPYQQALHLDE